MTPVQYPQKNYREERLGKPEKTGGATSLNAPVPACCNIDFDGICSGLVHCLLLKMDYIVLKEPKQPKYDKNTLTSTTSHRRPGTGVSVQN